jgi:hypothetical protein
METASGDFQRSALLLSNHSDVLHELVQFAQLGELQGDNACSESVLDSNLKRKTSVKSPAAKKARRAF